MYVHTYMPKNYLPPPVRLCGYVPAKRQPIPPRLSCRTLQATDKVQGWWIGLQDGLCTSYIAARLNLYLLQAFLVQITEVSNTHINRLSVRTSPRPKKCYAV